MKRFALLVLLSLLVSLGCASTQPINDAMYAQYLSRSFNYSKNKCFDATIAVLNESKIGIEKQDKEKGTITTEKAGFYIRVETGQHTVTQTALWTHKYYLQIIGNNSNATVKAIRYRVWRNNIEQTEISGAWFNENVWNPFLKEIQEKLTD